MTDHAFEAWRERARAADILDVAMRPPVSAALKKRSREHVGPCPRCAGKDRFSVNPAKQIFNCRGAAGGDVIAMVMHCQAVTFLAACELINGEPPPDKGTQLTDAARGAADKLRAESAARAERREADENLYRERERQKVGDIYKHAHPLAGSSAEDYLTLRGLSFPPTPQGRAERIKCVEAMPYFVGGGLDERAVHRGPAMIMPIVDRERKFRGLHFTYLDLSTAKGKLQLEHEGELVDAKKSRGSVGGNHVELIGPAAPRRLVLGEGAEKVIAVWQALDRRARAGELPIGNIALDETAFWSACNLGNLAGPAADTITHPTRRHEKSGRAVKVAGQVPDFNGVGIAIPDTVVDLVLLGDSTSDEFSTRLAMARGCARYAAPGRTVRVAWAPAGKDFDDLWRECDQTPAAVAGVAATIAGLVEAAAPAEPVANYSPGAREAGRDRDPGGSETENIISFPARARDSAPGAPQDQTSAGDAGAPSELPIASAHVLGDVPPDAVAAALGPAPPPASAENLTNSSRSGGNAAKSADRTQWGGPPRKYGDGAEALDRWLATFPLTDLGNVERFVQRQRGRLIHCPALGWHWWDGRRWSREGAEGKATIAEHETARAIQREAQAIVDTDQDIVVGGTDKEPIMLSDRLFAWGRTSENASRLNPMSKRAAPALQVQPHELDADAFKINLRNGTLIVRRVFTDADGDWRSWEKVSASIRLKPHDPDDLITKISPVAFDRAADCPTYDDFMDFVQPSRDVQRFIDDFDGYSLTGDATEQVLVFHHGKGKNGKSTQINIKLFIAGDYGRSIPIDTFAQEGRARQAGQATPDLAMLHRVRYLSTSEPQKNWKLDEALIKVLTGGDEVPVRELHKPYFMLRPEFKLGMNGNHKPRIDGGEAESGMWRRVKLVPWGATIPKDKRDKHFGDLLKGEAAGILNRMLEGLERWMKTGLVEPAEVAAATEQFRQDSDPLGRFLEFCTKPSVDGRVQTTALYQVFQAWAKAFGEAEWKPNGFGRAMTERGFLSKKSDLNYWLSIELIKGVNDFVDHQGNALVLGGDDGGGSNEGDRRDKPQSSAARGAREAGEYEQEPF